MSNKEKQLSNLVSGLKNNDNNFKQDEFADKFLQAAGLPVESLQETEQLGELRQKVQLRIFQNPDLLFDQIMQSKNPADQISLIINQMPIFLENKSKKNNKGNLSKIAEDFFNDIARNERGRGYNTPKNMLTVKIKQNPKKLEKFCQKLTTKFLELLPAKSKENMDRAIADYKIDNAIVKRIFSKIKEFKNPEKEIAFIEKEIRNNSFQPFNLRNIADFLSYVSNENFLTVLALLKNNNIITRALKELGNNKNQIEEKIKNSFTHTYHFKPDLLMTVFDCMNNTQKKVFADYIENNLTPNVYHYRNLEISETIKLLPHLSPYKKLKHSLMLDPDNESEQLKILDQNQNGILNIPDFENFEYVIRILGKEGQEKLVKILDTTKLKKILDTADFKYISSFYDFVIFDIKSEEALELTLQSLSEKKLAEIYDDADSFDGLEQGVKFIKRIRKVNPEIANKLLAIFRDHFVPKLFGAGPLVFEINLQEDDDGKLEYIKQNANKIKSYEVFFDLISEYYSFLEADQLFDIVGKNKIKQFLTKEKTIPKWYSPYFYKGILSLNVENFNFFIDNLPQEVLIGLAKNTEGKYDGQAYVFAKKIENKTKKQLFIANISEKVKNEFSFNDLLKS